jgi:hypothetical protein
LSIAVSVPGLRWVNWPAISAPPAVCSNAWLRDLLGCCALSKHAIEVYEVRPGKGRELKTALDLLDSDGPVPSIGDVLLMSAESDTGVLMSGSMSAFRVVDREYMFYRLSKGEHAAPQTYSKAWIHVRRLTLAEYLAAPGSVK